MYRQQLLKHSSLLGQHHSMPVSLLFAFEDAAREGVLVFPGNTFRRQCIRRFLSKDLDKDEEGS
jgi:hypothetical protein